MTRKHYVNELQHRLLDVIRLVRSKPLLRSRVIELHRRLLHVIDGQENPEVLKVEILRDIRDARAGSELVMHLRLLLAKLYMLMKEPAKARVQYRKVLQKDPDSIEAMIGIGNSFQAISRYGKAEEWFRAAYSAAEVRQDNAGQLAALDEIAINADRRDDTGGITAALNEMCRVLASAPRIDGLFTMIAEYLLTEEKGSAALPYLEYYSKHMLERAYPWSYQYQVLRPFVEIQRREGRSDEEVSNLLAKLRPLAADETVASDFDIASEWALLDEDKA